MDAEYNIEHFFMQAALAEARAAADEGEIPIGAVVVCGGRIVGKGHNRVEALGDATAHAEMQALTAAMNALGGKYLPECTIYVTVEPCIMCAGALAWSQIGRVVYGAADPKKGYSTYSDHVLHPKTVVEKGLMEQECREVMEQFFKKLRR
jgi:tRNA(adenine34) deaminase